jgi:hypothetical protein
VKLAEIGNIRRVHTRAVSAFTEAPGKHGQTPRAQKARPLRNKSKLQTQSHSKATSTQTAAKSGASGLGAGDVLKGRNPYKPSSASHDTALSQDGSADAVLSVKANSNK